MSRVSMPATDCAGLVRTYVAETREICSTNPFEWRESTGLSMVKSVYWKDGWIWVEPPRFDALGEGWYVLASNLAVEAIRRAFPDGQTRLWVERHSHGQKPYKGSWHLRQPF